MEKIFKFTFGYNKYAVKRFPVTTKNRNKTEKKNKKKVKKRRKKKHKEAE